MKLTSLRLMNFRNYTKLSLHPSDGVNLLLGDNAQGKTNLIEAIALTSIGRSRRTRNDRDMIAWGEAEARVRVKVQHAYAEHEVEMRLTPGKRAVSVNGAPIKRSGELLGNVNAVLFAPEDLSLIKDGPGERRRFMDMELSQADASYYYALQRYNRALVQRNALLRSVAQKNIGRNMMDIWEDQLCQSAPAIARERSAFIDKLMRIAGERHRDIASNDETLTILYKPSPACDADQLAEALRAALLASRDDDIRRGHTSVGPHRDDFVLRIQDKDSRIFASQGQQRTAALALKLSELRFLYEKTGEWPILLLDDVMSELDERRQRALVEHIQGVQTFITAAQRQSSLPSEAKLYRVEGGVLTED